MSANITKLKLVLVFVLIGFTNNANGYCDQNTGDIESAWKASGSAYDISIRYDIDLGHFVGRMFNINEPNYCGF